MSKTWKDCPATKKGNHDSKKEPRKTNPYVRCKKHKFDYNDEELNY